MTLRSAPGRRRATRARGPLGLLVVAVLTLAGTVPATGSLTPYEAVSAPAPAPSPTAVSGGPDEVDLPRAMSGRAAVRALADELPSAAQLNDRSPAELRRLLVTDAAMWVDEAGHLFVKDTLEGLGDHAPAASPQTNADRPAETTAAPQASEASEVFDLHSLPGAARTIFLDFDGHRLSRTLWNSLDKVPDATYEGWDPAGDGAGFSSSERQLVHEVWARVAEDYAPYDVNVTTADPGVAALVRSSAADQQYGMRVLFTDSTSLFRTVAGGFTVGMAYLGVFGDVRGPEVEPALVFTSQLAADPAIVADVASHEVGHTLDLEHVTSGAQVRPTTALYGPLMTSTLTRSLVTQWTQPDLTRIATSGLPLRGDEAGDSPDSATPLSSAATGGVISSASDEDWYRLEGCRGLAASVSPADFGPNLDLTLRLVDSAGVTVASDAPATSLRRGVVSGMGANLERTLDGSVHHLVVTGGGDGPGGSTRDYDATGSLGAYTLDVAGCATSQRAPSIPRSVQALTTSAGVTTVTWDAPAHAGGTRVTAYEVTVGALAPVRVDGSRRSHSVATGTGRRQVSVRARNSVGPSGAVTVRSGAAPSAPRTASLLKAPEEWGHDSRFRLLRFSGHDDGGLPLTGVTLRLDSTTGQPVLDEGDPDDDWLIPVAADSDGRTAWVRLSNAAGPGRWKSFVIRPSVVAPRAPTRAAVRHDESADRLTFTWRAPQDDGGAAYDFRVRVGGGAWSTLDSSTTTFHLARARPTGQRFEVRAVGAAGASPVARAVALRPGTTAPGKGRVTRVRAGKKGGKKTVAVRWAPPRATGGTPITGHRLVVQRLDRRGTVVRTTRTRVWAAGKRQHTLTLAKRGRHRFAVESRNLVGWGSRSAWSTKVRPR